MVLLWLGRRGRAGRTIDLLERWLKLSEVLILDLLRCQPERTKLRLKVLSHYAFNVCQRQLRLPALRPIPHPKD